MSELPSPRFDHLRRMTDGHGLHEHATGDQPRMDLGYCTDDVARALILTTRVGPAVSDLTSAYLEFVLSAVTQDGLCHNRLSPAGRWTDEASLGDWWGRAVWALGTVLASGEDAPEVVRRFDLLASRRSPFPHSMAYAALGAAEVADRRPLAGALLHDAAQLLAAGRDRSQDWRWPEPRLTYDNAVFPQALMRAGDKLGDPELVGMGVARLEFLVEVQSHRGHLSVVPVGGRGPNEHPPAFDQQPIEVNSLANAGATALQVTGDERWRDLVGAAAGWFTGLNDVAVSMFDDTTGAGYDGLKATGRNLNRGAESTLAANSTLLTAHLLGRSACPVPPSSTMTGKRSAPIRTA